MYTLYWERLSGAIAPQVMLEEIGVDYDKKLVDMAAGEHFGAEYRAINPAAQIPALKLPDGRIMGETAAMAIVLGERHPESRLVPQADDPDRPSFLFWLLYMAVSGYKTFSRAWHPEQFTTDESGNDTVRLAAEHQLALFFDVLEGGIGGDPYFLSRGFTALDIYLTMLTGWHGDRAALFQGNPKIDLLSATVEDRPAYRKVMDDHGI
jgi:glutathione S-transferase